jgi:type IV pilus assembly protein PilB
MTIFPQSNASTSAGDPVGSPAALGDSPAGAPANSLTGASAPAVPAAPRTGPRLGDLLIQAGLASEAQVNAALAAQATRRKRLGEILREDQVIDDDTLAAVRAVQLDAPLVDLRDAPSEDAALGAISRDDARRLWVLPLRWSPEDGGALVVAMDDPGDAALAHEIGLLVGAPIKPLLARRSDIAEAIRRRYRVTDALNAQVSAFTTTRVAPAPLVRREPSVAALEGLRDAPVVQIVNLLVAQALRDHASDLHLEPQANELRVRARVDGVLRDVSALPADLGPGLVSRIKILADLNIVEKQRAQDGQITMDVEGRPIDIRVATMRTIWGEKVVLRLLDRERSVLQLGQLGVPDAVQPTLRELLAARFGMVVVAGPTGSGKTTTLYAAINELDRVAQNVTTIEDPVEYTFENVIQTQVNGAVGLTFAAGLRAILRQDPDVILVGEMRDRDTAEIAVQASMTGHLVLSSMHATGAVGALFRLLEMGIEPYLVSASVAGIVGQRLMRRICQHCRIEVEPTVEEREIYESAGLTAPDAAYIGRGCTYCAGTGFLDRIGAYELLPVSPEIRRLVAANAHFDEVRAQAIADGMAPMRTDALRKAAAGITSVAEALRSVSG